MRIKLSSLFLLAGFWLISWAAIMPLRGWLMVRQVSQRPYLHSAPLGEWTPNWAQGIPIATKAASTGGQPELASVSPVQAQNASLMRLFLPAIAKSDPPAESAFVPSGPANDPYGPQGVIDSGPVIRLVIPALGIERAVVPVNMRQANGGMDWDTDKLFATQNRTDLVGQPIISTNPGEGGNVILIGHNYDNGVFQWEGVFVRIKDLRPGDEIQVYTADGAVHRYQVTLAKKVPWSSGSPDELAKHLKFLGPQPSETLTLVTCNGATIGLWTSRVYVQAAPVP